MMTYNSSERTLKYGDKVWRVYMGKGLLPSVVSIVEIAPNITSEDLQILIVEELLRERELLLKVGGCNYIISQTAGGVSYTRGFQTFEEMSACEVHLNE